jgi:hypothetical protein
MTASGASTKLLPPILTEIVTRLVNACEPERIYLFGSHARGMKDQTAILI